MIMYRYLIRLISSCIFLASCQKPGALGNYNFSETFSDKKKIVRLSCYQTRNRVFYSEKYLREVDEHPVSLQGDHAHLLWEKLNKRVSVPEKLTSFKNFTSKDYQIVAENDKGELSSVVVTKTYLREDGRYLACILPDQDYFSDLSKSEVALLGIK